MSSNDPPWKVRRFCAACPRRRDPDGCGMTITQCSVCAAADRREESLSRIRDEVRKRRDAGAPAVPSAPIEGVPYIAPKIPPGKVVGASATKFVIDEAPFRVTASAIVCFQEAVGAQVEIWCRSCGARVARFELSDEDHVGEGFDPDLHVCKEVGDEAEPA